MKNLLFLFLFAALSFTATAQFKSFTFDKTATSAAADTATGTVNYPFSTVTSLTFSVTKVSGTLAGKVYVYGSNVGNTYTLLDSATITNTSGTTDYDFNGVTNATKFITGSPQWYKYKLYYLQTNGSSTIAARALIRGTGR